MVIKSKIVIAKKTRITPATESADLRLYVVALSQQNITRADGFDPSVILADPSSGTTSREYNADEFIFLQGDVADAVFYVQSGKVKLTVVSQSGKEVVVASLPRGSHVAGSRWRK